MTGDYKWSYDKKRNFVQDETGEVIFLIDNNTLAQELCDMHNTGSYYYEDMANVVYESNETQTTKDAVCERMFDWYT